MSENWIENPKTGRMIKINSQTHRRLINQGVLKNTRLDEKILVRYDDNDDVDEIKKQLIDRLDENEIICKGKGRYEGCLVKSYKGNKGKPKKKADNNNNLEDFVNSMLLHTREVESDDETDEDYYSD